MKETFTISLSRLQFDARHGWHEEEAAAGNRFEVDAFLEVAVEGPVRDIDQTVNYVKAYELIAAEMQQRQALLETFLQETARKLENAFPRMQRLKLSIRKLTPPITNFVGAVGVQYEKEYA
jgi:7,8-dihydroneopterin aldolase/epimerase/oxygenase